MAKYGSIMRLPDFEPYKIYAPVILRFGVCAVFLYFGINEMLRPKEFLIWLPSFTADLPISQVLLVFLIGLFLIFFGVLLLLGVFMRVSALMLAGHVAGVTISLGATQIGARDFGITLATLAVAVHGPDVFSLDKKVSLRARIIIAAILAIVLLVIAVFQWPS